MNGIIKAENLEIDLTTVNGYSIQAEKTAQMIIITCDEEEVMAIDTRSEIKGWKKETEERRKREVDPFNKLVKRINDIFRVPIESFDKADEVIAKKILAYKKEKERVRLEFEAKQRVEFEEKLKKERERAKKENREMNIVAPPVQVMPESNTVHGETGKATVVKRWVAEVTDLNLLLQGIVSGKIPNDVVEIKQGALNKLATIYKKDGVFPGVKFFEEESLR
jgi:uncharacterized protein YxeA